MLPGLGAHAGRDQSRKAAASGRRACSRIHPLRRIGRAMAAAAAVATAVVEVAAPLPVVGVAAAAAAPAVVSAPRVRVGGPGVVCIFQLLLRLLAVLDEDAGSVGRQGQPWSPRGAYPRGGLMRVNGRGRRCNLSQVRLAVCGSVWLPLTVWQQSKGVGGLSRR